MSEVSDSELDKLENELPRLVVDLRNAAREQQFIIPEECDDVVRRCLRVKDFNQAKTLKLIKQLCVTIKEISKWDMPLRPTRYESFYRKCCYCLPKRDADGRRIIMIRFGVWDPDEFTYEEIVLAVIALVQYATYEYFEGQRKGIVAVLDCTGFSAYHGWSVSIRRAISLLVWIQKGVTCRMKAAHFIFHPRVISALYAAVRPFLSEKMQKRMIFHGDNLASLHEHVDPSCLPPPLRDVNNRNSDYEIDNFCDKEFHQGLLQQDPFFQHWEEKGFPIK